jgi:phage host-nuclease inhibitor protein Gam
LEFLADMPDRCLPAMSRYRGKLGDIQIEQDRLGYKYSDTVAGISFSEHLDLRIKEFNLKYAKKQWQEFVWADRKAYVELNKGKE